MYKYTYLMMVSDMNNNKYYEMSQVGADDQEFVVKYGRVGHNPQTRSYPISQWNKKYKEKIRKGYTDITEFKTAPTVSSKFKEIEDSAIESLINKLNSFSRTNFTNSYNVELQSITQIQLDTAQEELDKAVDTYRSDPENIDSINSILINLYTIVPRKMSKVNEYLFTPGDDKDYIEYFLSSEQDKLDSMSTQVTITHIEDKEETTILDAFGLQLYQVTDTNTIQDIQRRMGENGKQLQNAYRVVHNKSKDKFDMYNGFSESKELLFHASRNENWLSILQSSLMIRPAGVVLTGAMFGNGIYFSDLCKKSLGYSSVSGSYWAHGNSNVGYVGLFDVYTGHKLNLHKHSSDCYGYNLLKMTAMGYDSVHAHAKQGFLHNPEQIVYHPDQVTIKYLIEVCP